MKIILPKELVLNGTNNDGVRHRYSLDKNSDLMGGLRKLLIGLEFKEKVIDSFIRGVFFKETQEDESEGTVQRELEDIVDFVEALKNDKYELDIFFGKEKVILVIRIKENREKLIDVMKEKSEWISEEEKEKRLGYKAESNKEIGVEKEK